jgi:hypothetical protein
MKYLSYIFLFSVVFLSAYEKERYINFEPFLTCSFYDAIRNAGSLPIYVDYSNQQFDETFAEFIRGENIDKIGEALKKWSAAFFSSEKAFAWQKSNYRFGIFESKESTHKKTRLIQGINCKMCLEYCDWILENRREEIERMPYLASFLERLVHLDQICHKIFLLKVHELSKTYPEINQIFLYL